MERGVDSTNEQRVTKRRTELAVVVVVTLACLAPFLGKPFSMDDPLFIWTAKHIHSNPWNPYGFDVNWYSYEEPMWRVTMNPPLACYYMALAGYFGWSEFVLHAAFLLPALAASVGIYFLAMHITKLPLLAVLASVLTPVYLVSSTSVMCDTMMLAFWVWALYFWFTGSKQQSSFMLAVSSLLIGLCALTKYYGMSLLPLVAAYSILKRHPLRRWAPPLVIALLVLGGYYFWTKVLYGQGLLLQAASYAKATRELHGAEFSWKLAVALAFAGGCAATAFFCAPLLWSRRSLYLAVPVLITALVLALRVEKIGGFMMPNDQAARWTISVQMAIMALAGFGILALALRHLWEIPSAESAVLFCWVAGTIVFAGLMNWTVNGRSILPMIPAVGIVMARTLEKRPLRISPYLLALPLIGSGIVSVMVTWADVAHAYTARQAAEIIASKYGMGTKTLWFQGHWGFQYYMQQRNAKPLDVKRSELDDGDIMAIAQNNCNVYPIPKTISKRLETISIASPKGISAMNRSVGAGFYSDAWGPLPFAFGRVASEQYEVLSILGTHKAPFIAEEQRKLGREALERGQLSVALEHFREAVLLAPEDPDAYIDLGVAYAQSGDLKAAVSAFEQAVRAAPMYPAAHYNLATAFFQAGRLDDAITELERVLKLDPAMATARNNLAFAYILKGQYDDALLQVQILQEHGAEVHPEILQALSQRKRSP